MNRVKELDVATRREFLIRSFWTTLGWCALGTPAWAASSGSSYVVQRGDTLTAIANKYGVTVAALRSHNRLRTDRIRIGQRLMIPSARADGSLAPVIAATQRIHVRPERWKYIVLHHSAVEAGNARTYGAEHSRRGWEYGLWYHFVIGNGRDSGDGQIEVGPRWIQQVRGGHVRDQDVNEAGIGICLVGNFENHPPTARQLASMRALADWLRAGRVASRCRVSVHRWIDHNHTLCPGRHFPYADLKRRYNAS
ncbi:MAG TPA: N-acetylmuramoyl-L-alanine amidase [Candidatus Synoicihabitans sp.]|nr:N-acetylmuramoyl-L-alanine amidase [Candidatus Synoicihabitans sp.]